jgi:hypothetical protein
MWTTVGSDDEAESSADKEKEPKQESSSKRSSADGSESPDRERSHKKHRKEKKEKKERKHKVAHACIYIDLAALVVLRCAAQYTAFGVHCLHCCVSKRGIIVRYCLTYNCMH